MHTQRERAQRSNACCQGTKYSNSAQGRNKGAGALPCILFRRDQIRSHWNIPSLFGGQSSTAQCIVRNCVKVGLQSLRIIGKHNKNLGFEIFKKSKGTLLAHRSGYKVFRNLLWSHHVVALETNVVLFAACKMHRHIAKGQSFTIWRSNHGK